MKHILIVDDHADNRYYLEALLGGHGYTTESAVNGAQALACARQRVPDLIISDLLMPVMDGFSLLRSWKRDDRLKLAPFMIYTATYTSAEDQQLSMQLGADAFLLKPAEPQDLLACIEQVLERTSLNAPATRVAIGDEQHLLTLYNEALIRKLEHKTLQLEESNAALQQELQQRREVEAAMRRSEARLLEAQQVGNIGSWDTDVRTGAVQWTAQTHRIFETDPVQFIPTHERFLACVHPEDRARVAAAFTNSLSGTAPNIIEHRLLLSDQRIKYVEERWQVYHDDRGEAIRALGTARDMTEYKLAQMEIQRTGELLRTVTDGTPDAVFVKDREGRYLLFNAGAARLVGKTPEEVLGRDDSGLFSPEEVEMIKRNDQEVMQSNQVRSSEESLMVGGELRTFMALKAPFHNAAGEVAGLIGISRDISERRAMEQKLRHTLQDLDHRNKVLRDFAFVASHDLREPLRKIRAFSDILVSRYSGDLPAAARDYLERMNHTAARMQGLIDDVLAYSRVSGGRSSVVDVDLTAICRDVLCDLEESIQSSAAQMKVGALPFIKADPTQMRQMFQNILSNALKFRSAERTPQILIECESIELSEGPGIVLHFRDNGIGFANEFAERIFDPFQRLHARAEFDGTGIGLAIVSRIVERHHGSIQASGVPGEGACISIRLPRTQPVEGSPAG